MGNCKSCGAEIPEGSKFCGKCGAPSQPETRASALKCSKCGKDNPAGTKFCTGCGGSLGQASETVAQPSPIHADFSGLPPYYQEEFKKIADSKGSYKGKWNWAAAILTGFWVLSKGAYLQGILVLVGYVVCFYIFPYLLFFFDLVLAITYGLRGNYGYYNYFTKKKWLMFDIRS
jgi:hypothetical protein